MATMPTQVITHLVANVAGLSVVDATRNIFEGTMPNSPDRALALHEGPGSRPDRRMKGGSVIAGAGIVCINPMLQVKARDTTRDGAFSLCNEAFLVLDNFTGIIGGVRYLHIEASHAPSFLGQDEKKRFLYVVNFTVRKEIG